MDTKKLNWRTLNDRLCTYTESELLLLIESERQTARRLSVLKRLHQRYSIVRAARERHDLLEDAIRL